MYRELLPTQPFTVYLLRAFLNSTKNRGRKRPRFLSVVLKNVILYLLIDFQFSRRFSLSSHFTLCYKKLKISNLLCFAKDHFSTVHGAFLEFAGSSKGFRGCLGKTIPSQKCMVVPTDQTNDLM